MPWQRPTLKQLNERISGDFSGRLLDGGAPRSRSVVSVFGKVWAGSSNSLHALQEWIYTQVFPDTAEAEHLERWANVYGLYRKTSAFATGKVSFGGENGAVIPAGTLLINGQSQERYTVKADAEVVDGVAMVDVQSLTGALSANAPAGTALSLVSPLSGMQSSGTVDADGISGGVDAESDDALRARLLARLRQPPRGGSKSDYEQWALEVPGVTRAWCYPLGNGIGTVSLTFVTDNATTGPIPTAEMVQRVQDYIAPLRPASVKEWTAFAPEVFDVNLRIYINPDSEEIRQYVRNELTDFIAREGVPGATLYLSRINEAISLAPGEIDHILFEPSQNIEVPEGYFPIINEIVFVDAQNIEV